MDGASNSTNDPAHLPPYAKGSSRLAQLLEALIVLIVKALLPLSFVDHPAFIKFVALLDPRLMLK